MESAAAPNMTVSGIRLAILSIAVALGGCFATKYEMAGKNAAPPVLLNLAAEQAPVELGLRTIIAYNGPGSWKREALWDEYVVTVRNGSERELTIAEAALIDFEGATHAPGDDPWRLEKESQTLEQRYRSAGVAFARSSIPRVLITGSSVVTASAGGVVAGGVATVAAASVVALPIYYVVVWSVNRSNKRAVLSEFARRRLVLPLTLAAGEARTGSLFFPMGPNPQSLVLQWSGGTASGKIALSLEPLHGLHATSPVATAPPTPLQ
jgi:hypothetical protein